MNPTLFRQTAKGLVELENERLLVQLDPARGGSAWSIVDKASGKDVALCQSYGTRVIPALIEILAGQPLAEGRVDASPLPTRISGLGNDKTGTAGVTFSGFPVGAPAKAGAPPLHRVRLDKTCRLAPGRPQLEVDLTFTNESAEAIPLAAWISSGIRFTDEDADVYAPSASGTVLTSANWHKDASMSVNIPRAAAGWTGAVMRQDPRLGLYLAAPDRQVDAVWNWVGKFPGFTLGFGSPQTFLEPGTSKTLSYVLGLTRGLPRLDGASSALAGGLELDDRNVLPGQTRRVVAHLTAPDTRTATVTLTRQSAGAGGPPLILGPLTVELGPDGAAQAAFEVPFETADTVILTATIKAGPDRLRLERPVTVGVPRFLYRRQTPRLDGKRFWGQLVGERPLKARTQKCDRTVRHPMIPWLAPAAGRRLKVFFIGEVSFNMAIFRDLARRGDFTWDFVNVWGTGDMLTGPYGKAEVDRARRKLKRFKPDCVLTAGLRYDAAPAELIEDLWTYALNGGGLVVVGRDTPHCHGIWPGRLASPEVRAEVVDLTAPLRSLFETGVAPGPIGTPHAYRAGLGRIVLLDKQLDWPTLGLWGDEGPRNDLLPRYRGKTELPDWEYHFAQYLQLIRHAAQALPAAQLEGLTLAADGLTVRYQSRCTQTACLEYEILSLDRLRTRRGRMDVELVPGAGTLTARFEILPANAYVVHAWLLEGPMDAPASTEGGDCRLLRDAHARPVLDFAAASQTVAGPLAIEAVEIGGRRQFVPESVTVTIGGDPSSLARADVELEWRNGAFDRVVWRRREPLGGRTRARFDGIAFVPVSPEGAVAVRLWLDQRIAAEHAEPVRAWKPGNVADDDMAFLTAAGGEHDWYGTRMMKPWAEREAGFDFTYLRYGLEGRGFPWNRCRDNTLDPPIVDERPLRDLLARQLKHEFEEQGNAYVNMSDEFRLDGEYDWSGPTLQAFRDHLAADYGNIESLNAQWGTAFASFAGVMPVLLSDARQQPDNPSRWVDFRLFMDGRINRRYEIATEEAARLSPRFRVGDSGAYAPGIGVGINYYTMIRASGFTMTYGGLRSDWVRSFRKDGDIVGVWLGYGWAHPGLCWETLFRQYNILAWWGYLLHKRLTAHGNTSLIHLDLTPAHPFRIIGRQQREIRNGLGKLILHARAAPPRVLIPYSQASVYAGAVIDESYEEGANTATSLLNERNLTYRFIADEQVLAGELSAATACFFIFPNIDALPIGAASAYAAAIGRGCSAMADAAAGMRDGHGKCLEKSPFDAPFGVNRSAGVLLKASRYEPIGWTDEAPAELRGCSGQMVPVMRGLQATGSRVWARFGDGEPAVLARRGPAGSLAVMLNTRLPWVASNKVGKALNPEDRPDELSPNQTVGRLFDHLLHNAGLVPFADVQSETVKPRMIVRFEDGRARYFGLALGDSAGPMTVTLPETGHTYDSRAGRHIGCVNRFADAAKEGELAKVYAQLPYAVSAIKAQVLPRQARPGDAVTLSGCLVTADGAAADQHHVVHAELTDPTSERPVWHQVNLDAPQGRFTLTIPLALNAPPGRWCLDLRDAATGVRSTVRFTVTDRG